MLRPAPVATGGGPGIPGHYCFGVGCNAARGLNHTAVKLPVVVVVDHVQVEAFALGFVARTVDLHVHVVQEPVLEGTAPGRSTERAVR